MALEEMCAKYARLTDFFALYLLLCSHILDFFLVTLARKINYKESGPVCIRIFSVYFQSYFKLRQK